MVTPGKLQELEKLEREVEELERVGEKTVIEGFRALSEGKMVKVFIVIPKVTTFIKGDENPIEVITLENPFF